MTKAKSRYLALLAVLLSPMAANAGVITIEWEFTDEFGSGGTVSGTIAGLVEGSNDGTGLIITVDSTPTGEFTGSDWNFSSTALGGDAFTVLLGEVVFADALFVRQGGFLDYLFFGGFGGYWPQLADYDDIDPNWGAPEGGMTFTSVPEPGTLTLLGIGLAAMGLSRRRRKI